MELGASGVSFIITELVVSAAEFPTAFVATTSNVYGARSVILSIVNELIFDRVLNVNPGGVELTIYPVIGEPPVEVGVVHDKVAVEAVILILSVDGGSGTACGIISVAVLNIGEVATLFVADTAKL